MSARDKGHVRVFLSADLVGSTAFKNSLRSDSESRPLGPAWANVFVEFYTGFPQVFERAFEGALLAPDLRPQVVKALGDELLLQVEVSNHREARSVVQHFAHAIRAYEEKNLHAYGMRLKGTAWIAGFPNSNHIATLATGQRDYIGPSMDTGFRLAKFAKPGKLIVSVDLALLMVSGSGSCDIHCDGFEPLSGVLDGRPYPILWYAVESDDHRLQMLARRTIRRETPEKAVLKDYCEEYIRCAKSSWLCRPYFLRDELFSAVPAEHAAAYQRADEFDERNYEEGTEPSPEESASAVKLVEELA